MRRYLIYITALLLSACGYFRPTPTYIPPSNTPPYTPPVIIYLDTPFQNSLNVQEVKNNCGFDPTRYEQMLFLSERSPKVNVAFTNQDGIVDYLLRFDISDPTGRIERREDGETICKVSVR